MATPPPNSELSAAAPSELQPTQQPTQPPDDPSAHSVHRSEGQQQPETLSQPDPEPSSQTPPPQQELQAQHSQQASPSDHQSQLPKQTQQLQQYHSLLPPLEQQPEEQPRHHHHQHHHHQRQQQQQQQSQSQSQSQLSLLQQQPTQQQLQQQQMLYQQQLLQQHQLLQEQQQQAARGYQQPHPIGPLQPLTPNALQQKSVLSPSHIAALHNSASPPSKRDLKSWWKGFKLQSKNHEQPGQRPTKGIFGVPLRESIKYANVAISLVDDEGKSYIYGYVPIVVAKCGVFLKEKATGVEGIFRLSGSEKRIKELKIAFDSPDRYGKGLSWNGYTVHDAANVLRRYLNDLPEPVVPLDFYDRFREPLRYAIKQGSPDADGPQFVDGFDMTDAIAKYQQLITELPPLNRQLLLYILDLLAVFAAKSNVNRMNSQNLAAIFQPGMLSHPYHAMAPEEYKLNQTVLIFLIENQDHFLIGMQGTAADEKTVQEVQRGTPPVTPGVAMVNAGEMAMTRTASNASAGAESVMRDGKIRRNRSTSSRNSRHSNSNSASNIVHVPSPRSSSPGLMSTPTSTSGGLARSNTLPARSPGIGPGRFTKRGDVSGSPVSPLTPIGHHSPAHTTPSVEPVAEVVTPNEDVSAPDPFTSIAAKAEAPAVIAGVAATGIGLGLGLNHGNHSTPAAPGTPGTPTGHLAVPPVREAEAATPSKERRFQLFQRSPSNDNELKPPPNKLKKKRLPSSANPSAQSSTASLHQNSSAAPTPSHEAPNPFDETPSGLSPEPAPISTEGRDYLDTVGDGAFESTPRVSQVPSTATITALMTPTPNNTESMLRPQQRKSPPTSLHSSFNEGSDLDQIDDVVDSGQSASEQPDKAKKRVWRLSRRKDELQPAFFPGGASAGQQQSTSSLGINTTSPRHAPSSLGSNANAALSTSSIGSGGPPQAGMGAMSFTGASGSSEPALSNFDGQEYGSSGGGGSVKDEAGKGKLSGWIKNKYRNAKETAEQRRNKSPPPAGVMAVTDQLTPSRGWVQDVRGKSLDLKRASEEDRTSNH